jgi:abortive infection bacteriophage resistance protein
MIYELSHRHGTFWYTNATLFGDPAMHALTMQTINQEYGRTDEKFIAEFRKNYSNPLPPSWMMLELTSFGTLSTLYKKSGFYTRFQGHRSLFWPG